MTKISDLTALTGAGVDEAVDLLPIVDMSAAGAARNKKITVAEAKIALDVPAAIAELDDVPDVNAPTPSNGDVLTWDSTPGEWVSTAPVTGSTTLDGLTDVNAPTPGNGEVLTWDSTPGEWVSQALPGAGAFVIGDATDVDTTGAASGNVLTYDGAQWEPVAPSGSAFSGALVHKTSDETTANYSAGVMVPWTSEANGYDTDGYHDTVTNNTRLTAPATGKYVASYHVEVNLTTATEFIRAVVAKNGSTSWLGRAGSYVEVSTGTTLFISGTTPVVDLVATTDYLELWLDTEADTSITIVAAVSYFAIQRVA
jgi:hypothetical protein